MKLIESKPVIVTAEKDFRKIESAADLVKTMKDYNMDSVLPVLWQVARLLAAILSAKCTA